MQTSILEEEMKLLLEKQDAVLLVIESVDVLQVVFGCHMGKESSGRQFEQKRLDDGELGQKMMVR